MKIRFGAFEFKTGNDHAPERTGDRMVIYMNGNASMSRGKYAAQAVHAALMLAGVHHGGPVVVLGGKPRDIKDMPIVVHDAGHTELEPGTLTAGAEWQ